MNKAPGKDAVSHIYETCFSQVSDGFMETLVKEIALLTNVQTVMIQRLLTYKEYNDIKHNEGCPYIHLIDPNIDSNREVMEPDNNTNKLEYLLVKACYSTLHHPSISKHSAVSIMSLPHTAPHIQTLEHAHCVVQNTTNTSPIYPPFQSFVGIRLDEKQLPIGMITLMDNKPMDDNRVSLIKDILSAVQQRTKNEIERTRQRDHLIMVKNAALKDAQGKIKFLADMSHEIRTPMNAVIALTDLLLQERNTLNSEQVEHLEVIQTSGNHLLTVINDILDISKINHDPKFKLESRRFSMRKCVKDALNMARHQASMTQHNKLICVAECPPDVNDNVPLNQLIQQLETNGTIVHHNTDKIELPLLWKIDPDVPDHFKGDSMRITQILLNLCSNAVKFTKKGGIRVKIARHTQQEAQSSNNDSKLLRFKERYDAKNETHQNAVNNNNSNTKDNTSAGASKDNNNKNDSTYYYYEDTSAAAKEDDDDSINEDDDSLDRIMLEISVTDTGIGMPADRLPRLFKSFSQIDISTARRYGGTGLGLAISSMLVNRMGGGLWVESEEGLGSRFALTLPLTVSKKRPCSISTSNLCHEGSESSSAYASSSMIASPPSPGSSVSDGGSSIGERSAVEASGNYLNTIASSPSNSSGFFNQTYINRNYSNQNAPIVNLPWDTLHNSSNNSISTSNSKTIPSTASSPADSQQGTNNNNNIYFNAGSISNTTMPSPATSTSTFSNNTNIGSSTTATTTTSTTTPTPTHTTTNNTTVSATSTNNSSNASTNSTPGINVAPGIRKGLKGMLSRNSVDRENTAVAQTPRRTSRATSIKHYRKSSSSSTDSTEENLALLHPIRIMLAEDNVLNQKIAVSILKRLGFQDVIIAGNGREALDLMRTHKFDVIFMDLYMPEMDGLEATRYIISERKHNVPPPPTEESKKTPPPLLNVNDVYIIALTASASKQDRQICIDAGMNDFISKPFTMMEMKSALKNCASKRKKRKKLQSRDEERHTG